VRDPELLGELPDDVCRLLDLNTTARVVMIELATVAHIFERRSFNDATLIMEVLARRRFDPLYCGRVLTDKRVFFVMERPRRTHSKAAIALKLVRSTDSESGADEIWVRTGYIVGNSTLRWMLTSNRFVVQDRMRDR
jgi:hypothetical protein